MDGFQGVPCSSKTPSSGSRPFLPEHPLAFLLDVRSEITPRRRLRCATAYANPDRYDHANTIIMPTSSPSTSYGLVTLEDVVRFRIETANRARVDEYELEKDRNRSIEKAMQEVRDSMRINPSPPLSPTSHITQEWDIDDLEDGDLPADKCAHDFLDFDWVGFESCKELVATFDAERWAELDKHHRTGQIYADRCDEMVGKMLEVAKDVGPREVLYRVTHEMMGGDRQWMLEACHFEIYFPDRLDLRYIWLSEEDIVDLNYFNGQLIWISVVNIEIMDMEYQVDHADELLYSIEWRLARPGRPEVLQPPPSDPTAFRPQFTPSADKKKSIRATGEYTFTIIEDYIPQALERRMGPAFPEHRSGFWTFPVEPVKDLENYLKITKLIQSSSSMHSIFITVPEVQPKLKKVNVLSNSNIFDEEQLCALESTIMMKEFLQCYTQATNYVEHPASVSLKDGQPHFRIKASAASPYRCVSISFPPWITDRRYFLYIIAHSHSGELLPTNRHQFYTCIACPELTTLFRERKMSSAYGRVLFTASPFPMMRALLNRKEDFCKKEFIRRGISEKSFASMDICGDRQTVKFQRPFDETKLEIELENDRCPMFGTPRSRAVRAALYREQPTVILGRKGHGKTLAIADVACQNRGQNKLIVTATRSQARKLSFCIYTIDKSSTTVESEFTDKDGLGMDREEEYWRYFHWAREDIIVTTLQSYLMFHYYAGVSPAHKKMADFPIHTILIDNFECFRRDELYVLIKLCQHEKVVISANYWKLNPDQVDRPLIEIVRGENVYISVLPCPTKKPVPPGRFFFPLSRFHATESDRRFAKEVEMPALTKVLNWYFTKNGVLAKRPMMLASTAQRAEILNDFLKAAGRYSDEARVKSFEDADGDVNTMVIVLGGRNSDRYFSDQSFMRIISSYYLNELILMGTSNPSDSNDLIQKYETLTKPSQLYKVETQP